MIQPPPPLGQIPTSGIAAPQSALADFVSRRLLARPRGVDVVMIVAAVAAYGYHTIGSTGWGVLVLITVWPALWAWWGVSPGTMVGATVSLIALMLMWFGPQWHLGFEYERDCFNAKAQEALAAFDEPSQNYDYVGGEGRCGLMTWRSVTVADAHIDVWPREGRVRSVWFGGAGITNWGLFDGNGMAYSPEAKPICPRPATGDTHGCRVTPVGEDWYYYAFSSNIN